MKSGDSFCHHLSAIPQFSRCREPHGPYPKASHLVWSRGSQVSEPIRTWAWGLGARKEESVYISPIYKFLNIKDPNHLRTKKSKVPKHQVEAKKVLGLNCSPQLDSEGHHPTLTGDKAGSWAWLGPTRRDYIV